MRVTINEIEALFESLKRREIMILGEVNREKIENFFTFFEIFFCKQ